MKLLKLFQRWRLSNLVTDINSTAENYALNRLECLSILELIELSKLEKYTPMNGLSTIVISRFQDIDVYNRMLIQAVTFVKTSRGIPVTWDTGIERSMSLDRFLISDGHYVDIVKSVATFKVYAIDLCKLMEDSDDAEYGLLEHNKRMLVPFLNSVRLIATQIVQMKY